MGVDVHWVYTPGRSVLVFIAFWLHLLYGIQNARWFKIYDVRLGVVALGKEHTPSLIFLC